MPNEPRDPIDRYVSNLFAIQRLGNSLNAELREVWDEVFQQIADDIRRIDPTAPTLQKWKDFRTENLVALVDQRIKEHGGRWATVLRQRLAEIGRQQGEWVAATLQVALGSEAARVAATPVTQNWIKHIVDTDPFEGGLFSEWVEGQERLTVTRIQREIRKGMIDGEDLDQIVQRVRGKQAGYLRKDPRTGLFVAKGTRGADVRPRFRGGVWDATNRDTRSIVRTYVNKVTSSAHDETYRANADILSGTEFVSVLDLRTTNICKSLDGNVYDLDDPDRPTLPLHWGERSQYVPKIDWEGLGLPEPIEGERAARDPTTGKSEHIPASQRYEDWLIAQPDWAQNEALGPGRAELFRAGQLSMKDLVTGDLELVTLEELRAKL